MTVESLSIVIPAFNEEQRLTRTLELAAAYLHRRQLPSEVIVVDDGSTDRTAEVARMFERKGVRLIRTRRNRGKGHAVRRGVLAARMAHILFTDADLPVPLETLDAWRAQPAAEILIASRRLRGARALTPPKWPRRVAGAIFSGLVRALVLPGIRDSQCGFKLFSRPVGRAVFRRLMVSRFCFDVEVLLNARCLGYRVHEMPVTWSNGPNSSVHLMRDSIRMFVDLARIRWNRPAVRAGASTALSAGSADGSRYPSPVGSDRPFSPHLSA